MKRYEEEEKKRQAKVEKLNENRLSIWKVLCGGNYGVSKGYYITTLAVANLIQRRWNMN